jgi:ubiquinone/menaquinone biosynthesis C-methylase UbiE
MRLGLGFDHFDLLAPIYERVIRRVNLEPLLELLALESTHRLLDLGGGTGRVSSGMSGMVERVVLTDVSWGMMREANGKPGVKPVNAHAERLPFPEGSFDRILMVDAFHHVCDQEESVGEMMRVLAPGGRLVVEEPNIENGMVKLVALAEKLALMRSRFVRPAVMRAMFQARGGQATVHTRPDDPANVWLVVTK